MAVIPQDEAVKERQAPVRPGASAEFFPRLARNAIFCSRAFTLDSAAVASCGVDFDHLYKGYLDEFLGLRPETTEGVALEATQRPDTLHDLLNSISRQISHLEPILQEPDIHIPAITDDSVLYVNSSLLQGILAAQKPYSAVPALAEVPTLLRLAGLRRGWDGYDGEPIDQSVVDRALDVLSSLATVAVLSGLVLPRMDTGPTPAGSILLEWELSGGYFSIDCPPEPEPLSLYLEHSGGPENEATSQSAEDFWPMISPFLSAGKPAPTTMFYVQA